MDDTQFEAVPAEERARPFEDECVDLLCRQEQKLARMAHSSSASASQESLDFAKQMLLEFLEFAELHFDRNEFSCVASWLGEVFEHTKEVESELRQKRSLWVRMFSQEGALGLDTLHSYRQLGINYAQLYWEFFGLCGERFADDEAREDFLASVILFLKEFGRQW